MIQLELVRAREGDDPHAFQGGRQHYLCRSQGGAFHEVTLDWDATLLDNLASSSRATPGARAAAELGERLRAFISGTALQQEAPALINGETRTIQLVFSAAELYALPWELLTLGGSGLCLGQAPGAHIVRRWPGLSARPPARVASPEPGRLLLAWSEAAGPCGWRAHRDALAEVATRFGAFDVERDVLGDASLSAIVARLAEARRSGRPYTALQVLCHGRGGAEGGALLLTGSGSLGVDGGALRGALSPFLDSLRLIVLCACEAGSTGAPGGILGGPALALHRAGAEAVVAPRVPISLGAAEQMTRVLHHALLQEARPLEEAVARLRGALQAEAGMAWAAMQLFAHTDPGEDVRPYVLRPYRGLLRFEDEHRGLFFGREQELTHLVERVVGAGRGERPRLQLLCGASGVGKSSLITAGLIPALREAGWRCVVLRPGPTLDAELEQARAQGSGPLLVVVDPFQELFRLEDPRERDHCFRLLQAATGERDVVVLAAIRLDYLGRCEEIRLADGGRLDALIYDDAHRVFLGALSPERLAEAITGPAARVGLQLEPGLVEVLLDETGAEPGALPLLQHLLDRLWLRREGRLLTHRALRALGGLSGALAGTAQSLLAGLEEEDRERALRLLVPLVEPADEGRPAGRRRALLDTLLPADPQERRRGRALLDTLADARLVLIHPWREGLGVELAHDALLLRWPELRQRVEASEEQHRRARELERWAADWAERRADADQGGPYLLRGSRLGYAQELAQRAHEPLPAPVLALLEASAAAEAGALERERRQLEERETLAQAALRGAARARDAALLATARARRTEDPTLAILLLRAVSSPEQPLDWAGEALGLLREPVCIAEIPPMVDLRLLTLGPQARPLALWARGSTARLGSPTDSAEPIVSLELLAPPVCADWAPDGASLFVGTEIGEIVHLSLNAAPRTLFRLRTTLTCLRVSADGARVAVGGQDGRVRVYTLDERDAQVYSGHSGAITDLDWSTDGALLLSASEDGSARLWSLADRDFTVLRGPRGAVSCARLSPRGARLLLAGEDGLVRIWDRAGGVTLTEQSVGCAVRAAIWRPSGGAVVGDALGRLHLLGQDGRERRVLAGASVSLSTLSLGQDGTLRTIDAAGRARIWRLDPSNQAPWLHRLPERRVWDLGWLPAEAGPTADAGLIVAAGERTLERVVVGEGSRVLAQAAELDTARALALAPNGRTVAVACEDDVIWLIDLEKGRSLGSLARGESPLRALAWSADGELLACGDADGCVRLLDRELRLVSQIVQSHEIRALAFDSRSTRLLSLSADGTLLVWSSDAPEPWRIGTPRARRQSEPPDAIVAARWASALGVVLLGFADGRIALADPVSRSLRPLAQAQGRVRALAASSAGAIAFTGELGQVWLVPAGGGPERALRSGRGPVRQLEFDARGAHLLGVDESGKVWLLAVSDAGDPLEIDLRPARATLASLDATGERLAVAGDDGVLRVWPLSTKTLRGLLSEATGLELTADQRRRYLGEE